jgi:hypothetical protein
MMDGAKTMADFKAKRIARRYVQHFQAAPERVFPVLCPVREYEWIEPWKCEVVHSDSGFAEKHCVFRTGPHGDEPGETWVISSYEPPTRIEFVRFNDLRVIDYSIVLEHEGDGLTSATNVQVLTALSLAGNELLETLTNERFVMELRMGEAMLNHYLSTGKRLALSEALARAQGLC